MLLPLRFAPEQGVMHQSSSEQMEEKVEYLFKEARELIDGNGLSEILFCPYHGRARGQYFHIPEIEIENRIKASVYEGFYVNLVPTLTQLIICTWEYPGPEPKDEYVKNLIDIPGFVKDLDGE